MVLTNVGLFEGIKQNQVWTNKVLVGGSDPIQTTGAVGEWAVSGTQSTMWVSGTISGTTVQGVNVIGTTQVSGLQFLTPGSLTFAGNLVNITGSPYSNGLVFQMTTRSIITGGMFVWLSGAATGAATAMGSPQIAATSPIGVALATVGSNATVSILTHGIYPMIAEGTILQGANVKPGVGASYNTVLDAGSPSYGVVGTALQSEASGTSTKIFVYIGKGNAW